MKPSESSGRHRRPGAPGVPAPGGSSDSSIRRSIEAAKPLAAQLEAARRNPNLNFGKTLLLEEIGHGGMGVVYRAWQEDLRRMVAVKVLPAHASEASAQRFVREARLASKLRHPNIVTLYEFGEHQGRPWFSMDLVEGGSLDPLVRGRKMPAKRLMEVLRDIARALEAAHAQGVVHRDIKPANILLGADGTPFLTDFGLAGDLDEAGSRLTVSGAVMGTPAYMSPEQARGRAAKLDARTDIYSLGAVMYEGLTGHTVVPKADILAMVQEIINGEPARPSVHAPGVPKDAETICLKCLEKNPGRRYATAGELADDIDRFLDGRPVDAKAAGMIGQLGRSAVRKRAQYGVGAAVAAVMIVAGWIAFRFHERDREIADLRERLAHASTDAEKREIAKELAEKTGAAPEPAKPKVDVPRPVDPKVEPPPVDPKVDTPKPPAEKRTAAPERDIRDKVGRGEYAAALAVVDAFKPETDDERTWAEASRRFVAGQARLAFDAIDEEARLLLADGKPDEAVAAWEGAKKLGLVELVALADARIAEARPVAVKPPPPPPGDPGPLLESVAALCAKRRYDEALREIDAARSTTPLRAAVEGARSVLAAAERGANASPGKKLTLSSGECAVESAADGQLKVTSGKATLTFPFATLPADAVADLAAAGGATPAALGAFWLFEGKPDLAAKAWAQAPERQALENLAADLGVASLNREAAEALEALLKAAEKKDWKKAREILGKRDRYTDAPGWIAARDRVDEIAFDAAEKKGDDLFAVPARKNGAVSEWRYDFSKPEQLRDWAQADDGVWNATKSFGLGWDAEHASLQDCGLSFIAPLEGEMRIAAELRFASFEGQSRSGLQLGGYSWKLRPADMMSLYTPDGKSVAEAPDPKIDPKKVCRAEMTIARGRVQCFIDGRRVMDEPVTQAPLPSSPMVWCEKNSSIQVDSVVLSGQLTAGWAEDARAARDLFARAARPGAAGKVEALSDGKSLGEFRKEEDGTWEVVDDALKGHSPDMRTFAELHGYREMRNFRLRFEYRIHSGQIAEVSFRLGLGQFDYHLPADKLDAWRKVEVVAAEDALRCLVDDVVPLLTSDRVVAVRAGGMRIKLQAGSASFRRFEFQEVRGLPTVAPWREHWTSPQPPKDLKLEGIAWDEKDGLLRGKGSITPPAAAGQEWQLVLSGQSKDVAVRIELAGEAIWEAPLPENGRSVTVRWRGPTVDVLLNGVPVVHDHKVARGPDGLRFVVTQGTAMIAGVLDRPLPR